MQICKQCAKPPIHRRKSNTQHFTVERVAGASTAK